jgi:hypothetical protein
VKRYNSQFGVGDTETHPDSWYHLNRDAKLIVEVDERLTSPYIRDTKRR